MEEQRDSIKKTARLSGILYLLMGITSAFGLLYVPSKIIIAGNAAATAKNIIASESLFRIGIASTLIGQVIFIFLVLALYHLFKSVNKTHARLMVILVAVAVPTAFLNTLNQIGALIVLGGADYLKVFEQYRLNALAMIFLDLYNQGIVIVGIFWGLWLFPFGVLVFKSGFLPRILGILLIINCFSYLVDSFTFLLIPGCHDIVSKFTMAPNCIGEFSIILWFLIMGAKEPKPVLIDANG
jgi:hypothetical protein